MSRRRKMSKKGSKRNFTKGAKRVNKTNYFNPIRGGIRL